MLTVFIQYKDKILYLRPFEDHKEAIDFYAELFDGCTFHDSVLGITTETEIKLGEPKKQFYIS